MTKFSTPQMVDDCVLKGYGNVNISDTTELAR